MRLKDAFSKDLTPRLVKTQPVFPTTPSGDQPTKPENKVKELPQNLHANAMEFFGRRSNNPFASD